MWRPSKNISPQSRRSFAFAATHFVKMSATAGTLSRCPSTTISMCSATNPSRCSPDKCATILVGDCTGCVVQTDDFRRITAVYCDQNLCQNVRQFRRTFYFALYPFFHFHPLRLVPLRVAEIITIVSSKVKHCGIHGSFTFVIHCFFMIGFRYGGIMVAARGTVTTSGRS